MGALLAISRVIDAVIHFIGYNVRWLVLIAVLISAVNAIVRKAFDTSSNAWLELQWLLFGAVFLLAASYTLQKNAHVRIDVVYQRLGATVRAWLDLASLLALGGFVGVLTWRAWATLDETLLFGSRARTALQTPLWIPQSLWLAGLAFFLLCLVFLAVYVLVLLMGGQVRRVGHIAGIPHVSGTAERDA